MHAVDQHASWPKPNLNSPERGASGDSLTLITRYVPSRPARRLLRTTDIGLALDSIGRKLRVGFLCCLAVLPGGCGVLDRSFLSPAGPVASAMRSEFWFVCIVLLFVVGPVFLMVPLIGWHYRLSNTKSAYRPQWGFNWPIEGLIWIPPIGIVVFLSFYLWHDTHKLDPYKPLPGEALDVQVIAADWKWIFIYPQQGIATVNRLVIPAHQAVHLQLTSATVMQSLLIPQLAGQIYAMAGMQTQLNLQADKPGSFLGENVQFNGTHFQDQKFAVDALSKPDFQHWVAETHAQSNRLDPAEYQTLTRRTVVKPLAFGAVDPDLFAHVVGLKQPSGHRLEIDKLPALPLPMAVPEHLQHGGNP